MQLPPKRPPSPVEFSPEYYFTDIVFIQHKHEEAPEAWSTAGAGTALLSLRMFVTGACVGVRIRPKLDAYEETYRRCRK